MYFALLAAVALAALAANNATEQSEDEDGDSAPFMVEVRHAEGRTCGAALVSLRTALSSAWCARPRRAGAAPVWVSAPAAAPVWGAAPATGRRVLVLRVAAATSSDTDERSDVGVAGDPWAGAGADLALLELAAALPAARAILMATDPGDCAPRALCHLVRAELRRADTARLRIVDADLGDGGACAARGPRWPALRARTLCLAGPELCENDRGTGVVCAGKLCGVLSRSAAAPGAGGGGCGDVHAAVSVPRWRRFLQCAHTRGACGRDGDCAHLCTESWLSDAPPDPLGVASTSPLAASRALALTGAPVSIPDASLAPEPVAVSALASVDSTSAKAASRVPSPAQVSRTTISARKPSVRTYSSTLTEDAASLSHLRWTGRESPNRTEPPTGTPAADAVDVPPDEPTASIRPMFEFEPNRADFKKAGEYGDNAAEYAAEDSAASPPAPSPPAASPQAASPPAASPPAAPVTRTSPGAQSQVAPTPAPRRAAEPPPPPAPALRQSGDAARLALRPLNFIVILLCVCFCVI